jgi:diamine N-acetyltransferase
MLTLREITKENLIAVTDLQMEDSQAGFVEDNLWSIAECYLYEEFVPKAIYDDETPVGFVLYYFVEDDPDYVFLHRIMIDKHQQGKGYGVRSLELCFEEFKKEFPSIGCVELIHYPDNDRAAAVYEKAGFKLTGGRVKSAPGRIERGSTDINRTYEVTRRRYY